MRILKPVSTGFENVKESTGVKNALSFSANLSIGPGMLSSTQNVKFIEVSKTVKGLNPGVISKEIAV